MLAVEIIIRPKCNDVSLYSRDYYVPFDHLRDTMEGGGRAGIGGIGRAGAGFWFLISYAYDLAQLQLLKKLDRENLLVCLLGFSV